MDGLDQTDRIGRGATSDVYACSDPATGSPIALKVLRDPGGCFPAVRFVEEYRLLTQLALPGFIRAGSLFRERPAFTLDLLPDTTLASEAARLRSDLGALAFVAAQLLTALGRLHRAGWVHGDLKPGTVHILFDGAIEKAAAATPSWRPGAVIADLGLARRVGGLWERPLDGTPAYMAPECLLGETIDGRSDLYALGMILVEILTGTHPAGETGVEALLASHLEREMADRASISAWSVIVGRLLAADRSRRFVSAEEAIEALAHEGILDRASARAIALEGASGSHAWIARPGVDSLLDRFVTRALRQPGHGLCIAGPPASGRSRTLSELATRWGLAGGIVVPVNASEAASLGEAVGASACRTAALLVQSSAPATAADPPSALVALGRVGRPVLVILDGPVAAHDVRRLRDETFASEVHVSWAWSASAATDAPDALCVTLDPWPEQDLAALFAAIAGGPCEEPTAVHRIASASAGLPGMAVAFTRHMLESNAAEFSPFGWTLDARAIETLEAPADATSWALRAFEALGPAERGALEALALLGPSADELLEAATTSPSGFARTVADRAGSLLATDGRSRWIAHEPAARALAAGVDPVGRATLAVSARAFLAAHAEHDPDGFVRARLAAAAGLREAPAELADCAKRLLERGDAFGVVACAELGLGLAADAPLRGEFLTRRARGFLLLGRCEEALAAAEEALTVAGLSTPCRAEAIMVRAGALGRRDHPEEAVTAYREALDLVASDDPVTAARIETDIAVHLVDLGRVDEAEAVLKSALSRLADRPDRFREHARAHRSLGQLARRRGDWAGAQAAMTKALEYSTTLADPQEIALDHLNLASIASRQGLYSETETHLDAAAPCLEVRPHLGLMATLAHLRALAGLARCDWPRARTSARRACKGYARLGRREDCARALVLAAEIACEQGDPAEALRLLRQAVRRGPVRPTDPEIAERVCVVRFFSALGRGATKSRRTALTRLQALTEEGGSPLVRVRRTFLEAWDAHAEGDREKIAALARRFDRSQEGREMGHLRTAAEIAALAAAHGIEWDWQRGHTDDDRLRLLSDFVEGLRGLTGGGDGSSLARSLDAMAENGLRLQHARCAELALAFHLFHETGDAARDAELRERAAEAWAAAGGPARAWALAHSLVSLARVSASRESSGRLAEVLPAAAELLGATQDPGGVPQVILALAVETLRARRGVLVLAGPDGDLRAAALHNADPALVTEVLPISQTVVRGVISGGKSYLSRDAAADPELRDRQSIIRLAIRSVVCSPVQRGGRTVGAIYLDTDERPGAFSAAEARVLEGLGALAAAALELAELKASADEKTTVLAQEVRALRDDSGPPSGPPPFVYRSQAMQELISLARQVARTDTTVLIEGESGVGKSMLARFIHESSHRSARPFVIVSLPELNESLIESELFGHEKGAFTGAGQLKRGLFEIAQGGTLLLDEIGDLPRHVQAKLLRSVEERRFRRVGGTREIELDIRLLCATNRNLRDEIEAGRFRHDLHSRIAAVLIRVPPLRERPEDIPDLVEFFFRHYCARHNRRPFPIPGWVMHRIQSLPWRGGNVRDLRHTVERIAVFAEPDSFPDKCFPEETEEPRDLQTAGHPPGKLLTKRDELEQTLLLEALARANGNRTRAALELGVSPRMVRYLIQKYGLTDREGLPGRPRKN